MSLNPKSRHGRHDDGRHQGEEVLLRVGGATDLDVVVPQQHVQVVLVLAREQHVGDVLVVPTVAQNELRHLTHQTPPAGVPLELRPQVQQAAFAALEPSRVAEVVEAADELVLVVRDLFKITLGVVIRLASRVSGGDALQESEKTRIKCSGRESTGISVFTHLDRDYDEY